MFLREHRAAPAGFSDLINYAALVDEGVLLLKDGALMCAWYYEGPDLNSASVHELEMLSLQVNSVLAQLGDGWMLHADDWAEQMRRRNFSRYSTGRKTSLKYQLQTIGMFGIRIS